MYDRANLLSCTLTNKTRKKKKKKVIQLTGTGKSLPKNDNELMRKMSLEAGKDNVTSPKANAE